MGLGTGDAHLSMSCAKHGPVGRFTAWVSLYLCELLATIEMTDVCRPRWPRRPSRPACGRRRGGRRLVPGRLQCWTPIHAWVTRKRLLGTVFLPPASRASLTFGKRGQLITLVCPHPGPNADMHSFSICFLSATCVLGTGMAPRDTFLNKTDPRGACILTGWGTDAK